jgi:hypothetical protein
VIQPEIGHHFLELAIARHGASDSRRLKLCYNLATSECNALLNASISGVRSRRSVGGLAFGETTIPLRHCVFAKQLVLVLIDDAVSIEELLEILIVDAFGMELKVDPLVEAHGANLLHVAGARAEGESVQGLDYLLVSSELSMVEPGLTTGAAGDQSC